MDYKAVDMQKIIDYIASFYGLSSTYKCNFLGADNKQ